MDLVDQDRKALCADMFGFTFKGQIQQGRLFVRLAAIETDLFFHVSPIAIVNPKS
jgi:hypothetical protein